METFFFIIYGIFVGAIIASGFKDIEKEKEIKRIKGIIEKEQKKTQELPKECPLCGSQIKHIPNGVSKRTGREYSEFWACENYDCSFTCNKRAGGYMCNFDKSQPSKGRQNNQKSPKENRENKKEEIQDEGEIKVEDIPF